MIYIIVTSSFENRSCSSAKTSELLNYMIINYSENDSDALHYLVFFTQKKKNYACNIIVCPH